MAKVKLELKNMTIPVKVELAGRIVAAMTGNPIGQSTQRPPGSPLCSLCSLW